MTEALDRVDAVEAAAGEIISVAGIAEITIGETLADADDPRPLPVITVDEPSLSVTIGINDSPLVGDRRGQADGQPGQGPPRARARRQRLVAGRPDRAARGVGGAGSRRAGAGDPGRADAARGLRADGRQAPGRDSRDRRPRARAGRADERRRARRVRRASSRSCWRCARGDSSRWSTTAPAGSGWSTWSRRVD